MDHSNRLSVTITQTWFSPDDEADTLIKLFAQHRYQEAEILARGWTERFPMDAFGWKILGATLAGDKRYQDAISPLKKALTLSLDDPECLNTLGSVFEDLGKFEEAGVYYARAARQAPGFIAAFYNLARLLQKLGRVQDARYYYEHILKIDSKHLKSLNNLGSILRDMKQADAALGYYQRVLDVDPNQPQVLTNLGNLFLEQGRLEDALDCQQQASQLQPGHPEILSNLANTLQHHGRFDESLSIYLQAMEILGRQSKIDSQSVKRAHEFDTRDASIHSKLLFTLNYHPDKSVTDIFGAYQEFDRRFCQPHRASWYPHTNDRDPDRRLRIGYVSPDFRYHSSRHLLQPLLSHHNRQYFEVIAYAELTQEDAFTAIYRQLVDHWVPTRGLNDDELAARIRADAIDILIDLAGHTANNRLGVFARRPAPVSVSWMGYGYTTGLSAIDYFLGDAVMTPPGSESLFAERLWRINAPSMVYRPTDDMGDVGALPALSRDYVTFGTLTRSVRINHHTIRVWSAILHRLPGSRLVIDSKDFATEATQQRLAKQFAKHGIARERLELGYHSPPWDVLRGIDIGLDCFPHNSGTTLIESLYMGLPFVTLAARPSVGRIGSMLLVGAGRPEWIATTEADYVDKAVALASDLEQLAATRASLRAELEASPCRDEAGFAGRVEHAYRRMWQHWCETALAG